MSWYYRVTYQLMKRLEQQKRQIVKFTWFVISSDNFIIYFKEFLYLSLFDEVGKHDDESHVFLPQESPEIYQGDIFWP